MVADSGVVRVIPTAQRRRHVQASLSKYEDEWFYEFVFSDGSATKVPDEPVPAIHRTRAELIFPFLDEMFRDRWSEVRCLDLACHQGWFATQIALRGAGQVVGLDIRERHIEMASAIRDISDLGNLSFEVRDLYDVTRQGDGEFDITLFLGVLYHLDNPIEALRIARSVTGRVCVIETQVARPAPELECRWGSGSRRKGAPIAMVEADKAHTAEALSVSLVPTLDALHKMLHAVGFDRVCLCLPRREMYEQYVAADRVVVFAQVL